MNWKFTLPVLALAMLLLSASRPTKPALAQEGSSQAVWQAAYWNNVQLTGEPVLTRTENAIDHNWGLEAPAEEVARDRFSARWTATLNLPEGRYRFTATMDDGMRVWVDELLLINSWRVQSPRTIDAEIELSGGRVPVRVEYFDNTERAIAQLSWEPVRVAGSWYAEFFDNAALSGSPEFVRNDPFIDFNWGQDSPAPGVLGPDRFSARWRRTLDLERGLYRFQVTVDDGARLWVDDELLINAWRPQPLTTVQAELFIEGGAVPVRLEYFENAGLAQIALNWTRIAQQPTATPSPTGTPAPQPTPVPTGPPTIPPPLPGPEPEVLIDNGGPGFARGGWPTDDWRQESGGVGGSFLWTWNSQRLPTNYNWAQWRPNQSPSGPLLPGQYEVAAYIPDSAGASNQARYWVSHDNGFSLRIVNQAANGDRWVSLGTFFFDGADDYVSLADITLEEEESTRVLYDAVRWTVAPQEDEDGGEPALALDASRVSPGQEVNALGTGFPPGEIVTLVAGPPNSDPRGSFGQARVGPDGEALITFTMPDTWSDGQAIGPSLSADNNLVFLLTAGDGTRAFRSVIYEDDAN